MNIRELLCCTCTIAMHLFLGHSVYKHLCTVRVRQGFSEELFVCVVDIISVQAFSWALTISTLVLSVIGVGGERMGITIVLSHSHCTIESYRLLIIPSPHPPSASSLAVPLSSSMLLLSKRSGGGHDEEGEQLPSFILTCEPCAMTSQERRPVCQGNSSATEEIAIYFIPNGWNCSRVKSNAESYFTVLPSLCSRFFRLRIYCTGSGHSSAGSTSHGNPVLDQILFKYFCLIYSCIRLFCGLWRRRAARQLPLWPTGLMFLVNMGTLSGGSGEEEAVCPVYQ